MKKIFTFCTSLMMLGVASSQAQSFTVYSHGEQVTDGATIKVKGELTEEIFEDSGYSFIYRECKWDPKLEVEASVSVKGTVELSPEGNGWTICWPEQCKTVGAGKSISVSGPFNSTASDLQIHCEVVAYDEELVLPDNNSAKVVITVGDESMTLTLVNDKPSTGVEKLEGTVSAPVYYNLQGQKVDNPNNGVFIRILNGISSKVLLK